MPARTEDRCRVGAKRQLTLPRRALAKLKLQQGDYVEVRLAEDHIELVPMALIPRDQLWFWTPEWQARECEAEEDIAKGRLRKFKNAQDAIKWLRS